MIIGLLKNAKSIYLGFLVATEFRLDGIAAGGFNPILLPLSKRGIGGSVNGLDEVVVSDISVGVGFGKIC